MTPTLSKRLAALEVARTAAPIRMTPKEAAEVARQYEAALYEPEELDPSAMAHWATATVHQLASDYDAMLRDGPAPWE